MKKVSIVLLMIGLLVGILPGGSFAAKAESNSVIAVEKAIEIAKSLFPETKNFDQFDSNFDQSEDGDFWSLRWYSKKGEGSLDVRVNASTCEIAGFNVYDPTDYSGTFSTIPKFSRGAGEKVARAFIKKVAPSKEGELVLKPERDSYYGGGAVFHNYNFNRRIGDIEYPANRVGVTVNAQTGKVRNFYLNWDEITTKPLTAKLTRQDAEKIFTDKFGFELKYFKPQSEGKNSKPIMSIYEINNPSQVTIDALTGEIVQDSYYGIREDMAMGGMEAAKEQTNSKLEPFEQEVADELKSLISREKALEIASKAIDIPMDYQLNSSSLNRDWNFPELRIWSFNWNLEQKDRYGWASVEVDAKTGKVLSFNYSEPEDQNQREPKSWTIKTKAAAEKVLNDYLKNNYPEVVGKLRVPKDNMDVRPLSIDDENNQPSYFFRYERLVEGIPFSQNYVYATVDSDKGKITNFQIRFLELDFPKTDQVLKKDVLTNDFLAENQMLLVYIKDQERNLRLVYKLAPADSYRYDAVNGKPLDYNGQPIRDKKIEEITDIKGHWAEGDINLLNQMGLLHYEKSLFQPNGFMTQAELIKVLVKSENSYLTDATEGNWYDNYYRQGKQSGLILEKEIDPKATLTREQVAKFITRTVVKDKIAKLNIYQVPFQDRGKTTSGYQGYVAIVSGLGIMTGDGTNFHPQQNVKKGEACVALVRYLRVEK